MLLFLPGKGEEQRAAASLACLLCIQLGSGIESEEVFKTLKPIFKTILADGSANIQARQAVSVSAALTDSALEVSLLNRSVPLTGGYQPGPLYSSRRRRYSGELVDLFTSLAWRELGFMMSAAVSVSPASGRAGYDGVLREPVHPLLRQSGRDLSHHPPADEPAPHQRTAVLGAAAHHLRGQPAQRHPAQVRPTSF